MIWRVWLYSPRMNGACSEDEHVLPVPRPKWVLDRRRPARRAQHPGGFVPPLCVSPRRLGLTGPAQERSGNELALVLDVTDHVPSPFATRSMALEHSFIGSTSIQGSIFFSAARRSMSKASFLEPM